MDGINFRMSNMLKKNVNFKPEFNFEHLCYCVPRQYKNYATFLYAQSLDTELIMGGLMTISVELERVIIVF